MINTNSIIMNSSLDIFNNPNSSFENDFCVIDLINQTITWKDGMFNPKMRNDILYWFNEKNKK